MVHRSGLSPRADPSPAIVVVRFGAHQESPVRVRVRVRTPLPFSDCDAPSRDRGTRIREDLDAGGKEDADRPSAQRKTDTGRPSPRGAESLKGQGHRRRRQREVERGGESVKDRGHTGTAPGRPADAWERGEPRNTHTQAPSSTPPLLRLPTPRPPCTPNLGPPSSSSSPDGARARARAPRRPRPPSGRLGPAGEGGDGGGGGGAGEPRPCPPYPTGPPRGTTTGRGGAGAGRPAGGVHSPARRDPPAARDAVPARPSRSPPAVPRAPAASSSPAPRAPRRVPTPAPETDRRLSTLVALRPCH